MRGHFVPHSEEAKQKMREAKLLNHPRPWLGKKRSQETKLKMSLAKVGKKPWNKGLSSKTDMRVTGGDSHYNWKGGITPIHVMIRNLPENRDWQLKCFARDNNSCQKCGSGCDLEIHHKKSFSQILLEFLQKYSQFSPIEEKDILIRLALSYEEFWDMNNGETLCEICHDLIPKRGI